MRSADDIEDSMQEHPLAEAHATAYARRAWLRSRSRRTSERERAVRSWHAREKGRRQKRMQEPGTARHPHARTPTPRATLRTAASRLSRKLCSTKTAALSSGVSAISPLPQKESRKRKEKRDTKLRVKERWQSFSHDAAGPPERRTKLFKSFV